jgi:hypothetical protein
MPVLQGIPGVLAGKSPDKQKAGTYLIYRFSVFAIFDWEGSDAL